MRIFFAGSPAIAVPTLNALSQMELDGKGIILSGVLTNLDARKGRFGADEPSDISIATSELNVKRNEKGLPAIPLLKFEKLDAAAREHVASLAPDLLISFACGYYFGPRFLALFPHGGINIHPSLLPKYRGPSPISAVILAREKETGICIQKLAAEMDAGEILAECRIELSGKETALSLGEATAEKAALLLKDLLLDFNRISSAAWPQEGEASYCHLIKKEAGSIDWKKSAAEIDAQVRAYTPWPLAFTSCMDKTLFILECCALGASGRLEMTDNAASPGTVLGIDKEHGILIQTGDGILAARRLQWQTKKALDWKSFYNGSRGFIGMRLG